MKTKQKTTVRNNRISIADTTELFRLKRQINDSADAVVLLVKSVKDKSRQALAEALTCGKALLRAKEILKFGKFEKWRKENCGKVSDDTARNYMRLAKTEHVRDLLTTGIGLRQAYIAIGILKEDDSSSSETNSNGVAQNGNHSSVASTVVHAAPQSSRTPTANRMAKAMGKTTIQSITPEISKGDHLSRTRYLTTELIRELNNKLTIKGITLSDLKSASLQPLADWFKANA